MPKFRVTLRAPLFSDLVNPFRKHLDFTRKVRVCERVWEFEAKDDKEVRRLYKEAQDEKFPEVVGFLLHRIEELDE